jgi:small-conductance mechanosensitive channel
MNQAGGPIKLACTDIFLPLCLLLLFSLNAFSQTKLGRNPLTAAQEKPTPAASATVAPSPTPASLTELANDAAAQRRQLADVEKRLTSSNSQLVTAQQAIESLATELDTRAQQTDEILEASPSIPELQDLDGEWTTLKNRLVDMNKILVDQGTVLNTDIAWLKGQQGKWAAVLEQLQADASLQELRARISEGLVEIQDATVRGEQLLKLDVTLQTRVTEREQSINRVLEKVAAETGLVQKSLFQAESSPLWSLSARRQTDRVHRVLHPNYLRELRRLDEFVSLHKQPIQISVLVFLLTFIGATKMRRHLPGWIETGVVDGEFSHIFNRPLSLAFLATLLAIFPLNPSAPTAAKALLSLLFIVPVLRLFAPMIEPFEQRLLYALLLANLLVQGIQTTTGSLFAKRNLLALSALVIAGSVAWLLYRSREANVGWMARNSLLLIGIRCGVVLIFLALVANVFGFFALSQVLTDATLIGAYYGVLLYTTKEVLAVVLSTLLKTKTASKLAVVRQYGSHIERWLRGLLFLSALLFWVVSLLRLFTLRDSVFAILRRWLSTPLTSGPSTFTAGEMLTFILVLMIGFLAAAAIRVILREDVLKRLPVSHGVPFAVSTLTYYVLLFFVFMLALMAGGVEFSKFTLFTGAFGIGVGFGLQNAVNNFASGLILLFERPIREGDILEVEGTFGEVSRIGMRSTSISTAEEAEVIIPNSTLVAGKVINWSRLGRRRLINLPIRVAYGCEPKEVMDLLVKIARTHAEVLSDPAPNAFLVGFAEKGLDFTLVFWVGRYHLHKKVLSEVATSVAEKFAEAGIKMPPVDAGAASSGTAKQLTTGARNP